MQGHNSAAEESEWEIIDLAELADPPRERGVSGMLKSEILRTLNAALLLVSLVLLHIIVVRVVIEMFLRGEIFSETNQ